MMTTRDRRNRKAPWTSAGAALAGCLAASVAAGRVAADQRDSQFQLLVTTDRELHATITLVGRRAWTRALAVGSADYARARENVLALYVGPGASDGVAVAGTYEMSDRALVFRPHFPLVPGVEYVSVAHLHRAGVAAKMPMPTTLTQRIKVPAPALLPRTVVSAVYPTADTLPENLLKFYVLFSRPMRVGDAARHVALLDENGRTMSHALLETDTELWDASRRRLTVLLDPGRIKRGLRPNQELGAPLTAGRRYRLRVDREWRDADGAPLVAAYEKGFAATAALRTPLDARTWRVRAPAVGTLDAIEIQVPYSIDRALAERLIGVEDPNGKLVSVTTSTSNHERVVQLAPRTPWSSGSYRITVGAELEDVAGNNLQRLFDVDLADAAVRPHDEITRVTIPLVIAPVTPARASLR